MPHSEGHRTHIGGWLRAAVLGANDGIVSTASLVLGVAAAQASPAAVLTAGLAGLVGGALSMAAGEYVSVSSQRDLERADLAMERQELAEMPEHELEELTQIYEERGLERPLAEQVAAALTAHDALQAHARDELGLQPGELARPFEAAGSSALAFAVGGVVPLLAMVLLPTPLRVAGTLLVALVSLASLGGWSAYLGRANIGRAVARVVVGGAAAMGLTWALGSLFGAAM